MPSNDSKDSDEAIDEGAVEMAQAMADPEMDDDQPEVDGAEGITEQNSVVEEDAAGTEAGTLVAEEETNFTDNGPIADAEEARDETSQSISDGS
jgi:hypothetical protein